MPSRRIRLTESMKDDLATLCSIGREDLLRVVDKIDSSDLTIRRSQIEALIRTGLDDMRGEALARLLFGIAVTFRREPASAEQVVAAISRAISSLRPPDERLASWSQCSEAFEKLLSSPSLTLAAKALDISYDFERVYAAGRVLTSIRPVFDHPREEIVGTTIVQTLRLEFLTPDGDRSSISVALDMDDLKVLRDECDRAMHKAAVAKQRVETQWDIEAMIPGEEVNE